MAFLRGALITGCLFAALSCAAQSGGGLPDSVSTSEEHTSTPPPATDTQTIVSGLSGDSATIAATTGRDSTTTQPDPVSFRMVPFSTVNRYQREPDFAYANDSAYWKRIPPPMNGENRFLLFLARLFGSKGFRYFLYLLLGGVLLYTLYRIMLENKLHLFYRSVRNKNAVPGEDGSANPLEGDLDEKIAEALQAGDHRSATRYLFLKALRLLAERELILYRAEATDQEYIGQMASHPEGERFRFLARAYEHVWYGDFPLNTQQFDRLLHYFQDFYKTLHPSIS